MKNMKLYKFKYIALFLSIIISLNLMIPITSVKAKTFINKVSNYNYEDSNNDGKPEQWNYYAKGNNYISSISINEFKDNPNSLILQVTEDPNAVIVHQTIKLKDKELNRKYEFSQWIKTENLKGNGAFVRLQITDMSNRGLQTIEVTPKLTGNSEWTKLKYIVDIPSEIKGTNVGGLKIENYISAKSSGKVYFNEPTLKLVGEMDEEIPDTIVSLIENGGFEKKKADGIPDKWNVWKSTGGLSVEVDEKVFKEGKASVKISNEKKDKTSRGTLNQTIKPISNEMQQQSVKISQWIKTENFKGKGFAIRLQYKDKNGGKIEPMGIINVDLKENMNWSEFTYIIDLPKENIDNIVFEYLYDDCQGNVWIDNSKVDSYVKLKEIGTTPNNVDLQVGESSDLKLNFKPVNATVKDVKFSSENPEIVSVNESGKITANKNGTTKILITQKEENIVTEIPVVVGKSNNIKIDPINEIETIENSMSKVKVVAYSIHGLELNYNLLTKPAYGTVNLMKDGNLEYYPNKNYSGKDSFTIRVSDTNGEYNTVNVNINVIPLNREPIFEDFVINTNENIPITNKILSAKDPEGEILTYEIVNSPQNGVFELKDNKYNFIPNNNYNGYDSVKIKAIDNMGNEKIAEGRIYVAPNINKIKSLVKNEHPRILANVEDFSRLKNLIKTDKNAKKWFVTLKNKVDKIVDKPVVPYNKPDGLRLDTQASKNIVDLAFMYQLTGAEKYGERAWLELKNVSVDYPDWSHEHLLDTGMTAFGVAIGYDWLYNYLSTEQKNIVENAIVNKALNIAHKYYLNNSHFFVEDKLNWNFVCNTGFTAAALSIIGDNNSDLSAQIIQESFKSIQNGLTQYYPEGDSIEGVSYWDYGTRYLVYFLSSVSSAMKGENPFINAPGIKETPDFPMYMTGKVGSYNYSDNDTSLAAGYLSLWFAKELNRPDLTWYHKYYMENSGVLNIYDLLWYDPQLYTGDEPKDLDKAYQRQSVITMRKDWNSSNSSFVGFKGGLNGAPHGDLDIGSFVYDALGVRWATELGKENYNLPGYWEKEENGRRWTYYRKRAEGHNTLVINPMNKTAADQKVGIHSKIEEMNLNKPNGAYGIIDMSDAYEQDALKVKRGVKFINRNELLVRDEFLLKEQGEVIWQMHTATDIEIVEDGKAAILKEGNKRLYVKLLTKGENKFEVMSAQPYISTNTHENAFSNEEYKKLVVKTNSKEGSVDVWMAPYVDGEERPCNEPNIVPLELWKEWNPSTPNPEPDVEKPGEGNGSGEGTKPDGDGDNSGEVPDENKPGNEGNENPNITPDEENSNNNGGQLPNTGGKSSLTLGMIGILLVIIGGVLFIKSKKINK